MRPQVLLSATCSVPLATSPSSSWLRWLAMASSVPCGAARSSVARPMSQGSARSLPALKATICSSPDASLAATSVLPSASHWPRRWRAPAPWPCCSTAPSHSGIDKSLPRTSTATLWPAGCSTAPCRCSAAGTKRRAACVRAAGTSMAIGCVRSVAGSNSHSSAPHW